MTLTMMFRFDFNRFAPAKARKALPNSPRSPDESRRGLAV
jgi:hypothetical protein